ncbi:hypothetical protein FCI23_48715 [Actinacidiphila oryziradicis]|uniref:Uncharacterized protein n=1 Tax=Actinacidiphila oryziradicis TaxID=2571141 RepID=A0A4U0RTY0_9ACTN|nr:hypothetical protein FCI23_48715 [Actinacidiphila oryziradicis]
MAATDRGTGAAEVDDATLGQSVADPRHDLAGGRVDERTPEPAANCGCVSGMRHLCHMQKGKRTGHRLSNAGFKSNPIRNPYRSARMPAWPAGAVFDERRHQVFDVPPPPPRPRVTEYRVVSRTCTCCGTTTVGCWVSAVRQSLARSMLWRRRRKQPCCAVVRRT